MRSLALLALLSGCGRLGFAGDATSNGDGDVGDDARVCTPIGHDEDGDGIDDGCDGCPSVADSEQLDSDGDGVTEPCDPRPTIAGDKIASFEGFGGADGFTLPSPWTGEGAASVQDDDVVLPATIGTRDAAILSPVALGQTDLFRWSGIIAVGSCTSSEHATIEMSALDGVKNLYCEIFNSNGGTGVLQLSWTFDSVNYFSRGQGFLTPDIVGAEGVLQMTHDGTGAQTTCDATWAGGTNGISALTPDNIPLDVLRLTMHEVTGRIHWFIHIQVP
ncbi:hypothetical protein BH11MYX2_BH11MYX2_16770 [soil metagenome]